jgi:branched-chain amino acid aminotransferase
VPMARGDAGAYAATVRGWLKGIMWGSGGMEGHEWGRVVDEE